MSMRIEPSTNDADIKKDFNEKEWGIMVKMFDLYGIMETTEGPDTAGSILKNMAYWGQFLGPRTNLLANFYLFCP